MKAVILSDKDYQTDLCLELKREITSILGKDQNEAIAIDVGREDLAFCMGCFGCWVKKPGECVIRDGMAEINARFVESDLFIYLSPIVFGQFSANIKNAIDRFIPNVLPFFITRSDGSTVHPARYKKMPKTIAIGYGTDIPEEDTALFKDIIQKHRYDMSVFVFQDAAGVGGALSGIIAGKAATL
jgi:multimeric flavodoxin WrbA